MNARRFLPLLAVACLLVFASPIQGQPYTESMTLTLQGINGLEVIVEDVDDDAKEGGLSLENLRIYVEMRLRQARITILDQSETAEDARQAYFYVAINVKKITFERGDWVGWAYNIDLSVNQMACIEGFDTGPLSRAHSCNFFTTWDLSGMSVTGEDSLSSSVREDLAVLMDMFLNDHLKMNP